MDEHILDEELDNKNFSFEGLKKDSIEEAKKVLQTDISSLTEPYDPVQDVKNTLGVFLKNRLIKLQEDLTFEDYIKKILLEKISEASVSQLIRLLDNIQRNMNEGISSILTPFLQKVSELDSISRKELVEEEIFNKVPKEMIQTFEELSKFLDRVKKLQEKDPEAEKIKKVLFES